MFATDNKNKIYLQKIYPVVAEDGLYKEIEQPVYYNGFSISRFDHWLSNDEANNLILNFPEEIKKEKRLKQYYSEEKKFLNLYSEIYNEHKVFYYWENEDDCKDYDFLEFESKSEFLDVCTDSLREKKFMTLFIPDISVIIVGDYDLNEYVHYIKNNPPKELEIKIRKHGLYPLYKLSE